MHLSIAFVFALATAISATFNATNDHSTVYITEVHTAYTTYCPTSTELVYNGVTYTATESTTITITNCPCTVVKPVITSSSVLCLTCNNAYPTAPVYGNLTEKKPAPTGAYSPTSIEKAPEASQTHLTTSGAGSLLVLSSAYLAGLVCLIPVIL
ncbi:putative mmc protein [Erysiphe necator]|uniref:Putative mmc protein n=1 Tax=Uncinula necator TaxID=52586 RepID=A0A0B1P9T1_UNCNE|nr:putative mmc protein [Erysiphe necator]